MDAEVVADHGVTPICRPHATRADRVVPGGDDGAHVLGHRGVILQLALQLEGATDELRYRLVAGQRRAAPHPVDQTGHVLGLVEEVERDLGGDVGVGRSE